MEESLSKRSRRVKNRTRKFEKQGQAARKRLESRAFDRSLRKRGAQPVESETQEQTARKGQENARTRSF